MFPLQFSKTSLSVLPIHRHHTLIQTLTAQQVRRHVEQEEAMMTLLPSSHWLTQTLLRSHWSAQCRVHGYQQQPGKHSLFQTKLEKIFYLVPLTNVLNQENIFIDAVNLYNHQ